MASSKSAKSTGGYFKPELFKFLRELKENNRKDWFDENKSRFEADVKGPMLRFITDFGPRLHSLSEEFEADPRPSGGSMFRIYRDTRFAKDKSPYKTNVGAHFPHSSADKSPHVPGFYLHLEAGSVFGGGGIWQPDAPTLKLVRDRIVEKPKEWKEILGAGVEISGEALKRPPAGYDAEHAYIEDLKRKGY